MRLQAQALHGPTHGEKARPQDIMNFNFLQGSHPDGPMHLGVLGEEVVQFLPVFAEEHLGILQMPVLEPIRQDRRRGKNRPRPATAPYLIDAGNHGHAFRRSPRSNFQRRE